MIVMLTTSIPSLKILLIQYVLMMAAMIPSKVPPIVSDRNSDIMSKKVMG